MNKLRDQNYVLKENRVYNTNREKAVKTSGFFSGIFFFF